MVDRFHHLADWNFSVPVEFFEVPIDDSNGTAWARSTVGQALAQAVDPGDRGTIVEQLVEVRRRLISEGDPFLSAWVSIRTEIELTVGCVVTAEQFRMDPDDGPEPFAAMLKDGVTRLSPGKHTRDARFWRTDIPAGKLVGMFHRFDVREIGADTADVEQRTMFGVFPDDSSDMVRFTFTVADLLTFDDMVADTQAIVSTMTVRLEEKIL